jgi:hypothetical protein
MPNEDNFEIKEVACIKKIELPNQPVCKLGQLVYHKREKEYGVITKIEKIIYKDDTFEYILFALFEKEIREIVLYRRFKIFRKGNWEELDW